MPQQDLADGLVSREAVKEAGKGNAVAAAVCPIQRRRFILPRFLHYFPGPGFVSA